VLGAGKTGRLKEPPSSSADNLSLSLSPAKRFSHGIPFLKTATKRRVFYDLITCPQTGGGSGADDIIRGALCAYKLSAASRTAEGTLPRTRRPLDLVRFDPPVFVARTFRRASRPRSPVPFVARQTKN